MESDTSIATHEIAGPHRLLARQLTPLRPGQRERHNRAGAGPRHQAKQPGGWGTAHHPPPDGRRRQPALLMEAATMPEHDR